MPFYFLQCFCSLFPSCMWMLFGFASFQIGHLQRRCMYVRLREPRYVTCRLHEEFLDFEKLVEWKLGRWGLHVPKARTQQMWHCQLCCVRFNLEENHNYGLWSVAIWELRRTLSCSDSTEFTLVWCLENFSTFNSENRWLYILEAEPLQNL